MSALSNLIFYCRQFGLSMTIVKLLLSRLQWSKRFKFLYIRLNELKHRMVKKRVRALLPNGFISSLNDQPKHSNIIWSLWVQGEKNAPDIVKKCFEIMKEKCVGYELKILSKETWINYYQPTPSIQKKLDQGNITLTHFSDIIRMNCLNQFGGRWMDATMFLRELPFKGKEFYTIKNVDERMDNISLGRWASFYIGGENPLLYSYVSKALDLYWDKYDTLIDYFLIDYLICLAYEDIENVRTIIDSLKDSNPNFTTMQERLNDSVNDQEFENIIRCNQLHKLSYKLKLNDDPNSVYHRFLKMGAPNLDEVA